MHNIFINSDAVGISNTSALNEKNKDEDDQQVPFTLQDLLENGELDDELEELEKQNHQDEQIVEITQKVASLHPDPVKQMSLLSYKQRAQFI